MNVLNNLYVIDNKDSDHRDLDSSLTLIGLSSGQRKWIIASEDARQKGNIDQAYHCIVKALEELVDDEKQWRIKAACLMNRGVLETKLGKYNDAETTLKSSLDFYNECNGTEYEKCTCLMEMGVAQLAQGEPHLAETTFLKAKKYFETADDTSAKAVFYQNLAGLYEFTARFSEAWVYTKQSLEIFSKISCDPKQHAGCLIPLGNLSRNSMIIDDAETAYRDAINLLSTTPNPHPELARCWLGLGNVYMEQQKFEKAIQKVKKAIEYLEPNKGNPFDLAVAKMNLGAALIHLEQFMKAIPI
jgi:tetratricopeptide (TPR) repeat protein